MQMNTTPSQTHTHTQNSNPLTVHYKKSENIKSNLKAYLKHFFTKNSSSSIRHDVVLQGFGRQHKFFFSQLFSQFPQSSCPPVDLSQTPKTVNEVALESQLAQESPYMKVAQFEVMTNTVWSFPRRGHGLFIYVWVLTSFLLQ